MPQPEQPKPIMPPEPLFQPSSSGSGGPVHNPNKPHKWWTVDAVLVVMVAGLGWYASMQKPSSPQTASQATPRVTAKPTTSPEKAASTLEIVANKNYGNKYADGLLPVGDGRFVTTGAKKGYIYTCNGNFPQAGGAGKRGPWFVNNNLQWDVNKKATVAGKVNWTPSLSVKIENGRRVVTTNDLPNHYTGKFPISRTDPAYPYDANPNSIQAQNLIYDLAASPKPGEPVCMGGEVGVMLTGAALFGGFDAAGRDAAAWEVQDGCSGHPQKSGEYHYHALSRCLTDAGATTVLGFALDGFPITGPTIAEGNILTTNDLDECHGITSEIILDGKPVKTYHYVMTQDFPYSVSCFRAAPIRAPGMPENPAAPQR